MFSNLSKNLKSFIVLKLNNIKNKRKFSKQKNLDKKIVSQVNKKKLPSWKQFKQIAKTLSKKEKLLMKILASIILVSVVFLIYSNFFRNLSLVPKKGGELTEALIGNPLYINPILAQSHVDADLDLSRLVFSGLVKYDQDLNITPDLAEKYEISEDQKTYTFYLKDNLKWHDGQDLTADDIVFTIKSIQDPNLKSPLEKSLKGVIVEKIDDKTVKFTLTEPYAAFLNVLTVGIIPQHIWFDIPALNARGAVFNHKPIGSGPFKFKSLVKERSGILVEYTLERNDDYYSQKPYLDNIIFKFYPDYENATNALINKEVNSISYLPKDHVQKFKNKHDINLYNITLSQYTALFFNQKNNELIKDIKVRQALSYAIDKNKILEKVLQNQGQAIDGPILPNFLGYNQEITKYDFNPQKSLELLSEQGWKLDNEILKKDDQNLKVVITTVDSTTNIQTAELIQGFWNNIGVEVELAIVSKENIETEILIPRNYQILLYGQSIGYDPDLFPFWHSSQREYPGVNLSNYANRNVDTLLEEARLTSDTETRNKKYIEFQNLLIEDLPAIFLYSPSYIYPVNKKIKGIEIGKIAKPSDRFINIEDWYIKTKKKFFK